MKECTILIFSGLIALGCGQSDSQDETATIENTQQLDYRILEEKMQNDALIVSVSTPDLDNARSIAAEIVSDNSNEYMVRVFFYEQGDRPGSDIALIRYEWTQQSGITLTFDNRLPEPNEEINPDLPEYEVLDRISQMNGRVYGDVLVPSIPRSTPVDEIQQLAIDICIQENIDDICLYCTEDAYIANTYGEPEYYPRPVEPNAIENGFLGSLKNGSFIAGSQLYP